MEPNAIAPPRRSAIEVVWRQVVAGVTTREAAHDWAVVWVEHAPDMSWPDDGMIEAGLLYLHGLDMTRVRDSPNLICHGGPGRYVLSEAEVAGRLEHWLKMCSEYDCDPEKFRQRALEKARNTPEYRERANRRSI
ncbi:hypothetical protein [Nocardia sp. NBC_00511]|uniref:hypothetical protein n=1 Tax=Nocardia sp. NBC_00511 TaxID=2903591 RepID=UPI0030DFCF78